MSVNKRRLKLALARLSGAYHARFSRGQQQPRVVILCYHSVHPAKDFASASPDLFEKHLKWLRANCEIIRFRDAFAVASNAAARQRPAVALTFDDGYADNYEYAFPLLCKIGVTATFFVVAGLLDQDPAVVARLQSLRRSGYSDIRPLTWDQVHAMKGEGMDIGSHTYSHPNLAKLTADQAVMELRRSKEIIEDRLRRSITELAYPFGMLRRHVSHETQRIARQVGYQHGAAVAFRPVTAADTEMALPRFLVTADDVETLAAKIHGAWDFLGLWHQRAPLWLIDLVSPESGQV